MLAAHQIAFRGDGDEDNVVTHTNLLTLWPLLGGRVDCPPARLTFNHKVLIYIENHSVCPLVGIGTLPSPLSPASVPLPPEPKGGGGTLACG